MPGRMQWAVGIAILLIAICAQAEDVQPESTTTALHFSKPIIILTEEGASRVLPPGYYVPDVLWNKLDVEVKRLQAVEQQRAADAPSWWAILLALFGGLLLGYTIF